jgi:hypothetical protein
MIATYTVHVHIEEDDSGNVRKHEQTFEVTGSDIDDIREKTKKLLAEKQLPPVRSMNMHDGVIIVYCGGHPQRAEANVAAGVKPVWRKPARFIKP